MIRELFIYKQLKDPRQFGKDVLKDKFETVSREKIDSELSEEKLRGVHFVSEINLWCKYCANREICVDYYAYFE